MIDFSKKTYKNILAEQLKQVPEEFDKREKSIIQTALGPESWYLEGFYLDLDNIQKNAHARTAKGNSLDLKAEERGIYRKKATCAIKKGIFNMPVPIGTRFSTASQPRLVYYVTEWFGKVEEGYEYQMKCEEAGEQGNSYSGPLLAIDYVNGLESAVLTSLLFNGTEEESDDSLRERYFESLKIPPFAGNIAAYRSEILAIDGVGAVQVYPAWQGGGTVLCSILAADFNLAESELIRTVQEIICPAEIESMVPSANGYGIAPIGAAVTITTATECSLDISMEIQIESGRAVDYQEQIRNKIEAYLFTVRKQWGKSVGTRKVEYSMMVYIARIIYEILTIQGIINVTKVTINGKSEDMVCIENVDVQQIPVLGQVVVSG